jgi:hypothetical protein
MDSSASPRPTTTTTRTPTPTRSARVAIADDDDADARPRDSARAPRPTTPTTRRAMDAKIAAVSEEVRALRDMVRRLERATPRDDARRHPDVSRASLATTTTARLSNGSARERRRARDAEDDETAVDARFRARCRAHVAKESSSISIDDESTSLDAVTRQFTLGVVRRLPEDV